MAGSAKARFGVSLIRPAAALLPEAGERAAENPIRNLGIPKTKPGLLLDPNPTGFAALFTYG